MNTVEKTDLVVPSKYEHGFIRFYIVKAADWVFRRNRFKKTGFLFKLHNFLYRTSLKFVKLKPNPTFTITPGLLLKKGHTFTATLGHVDHQAQSEKFREDRKTSVARAIKLYEELEGIDHESND